MGSKGQCPHTRYTSGLREQCSHTRYTSGLASLSKLVTFYTFKVNELIEVFTLVLKTSFKVKHDFY